MEIIKKFTSKTPALIIVLGFALPLTLVFGQLDPDCQPGETYSREYGVLCAQEEDTGTEGTEIGDQGGNFTPAGYAKSDLFVSTGEADNITLTSATLRGSGGDRIANPTLPITAYFRYSTLPIQPVFCNDVYSANMISTPDINLGISSSQTFYQNIENLKPDTTYYYCAIVSNKDVIAYGGPSVVKQFHTDCVTTTVSTTGVTNVSSSTASLKGSYCSMKTAKTSFEYRKVWTGESTQPAWIEAGEVTRSLPADKSNIYGNYSHNLSSLSPNTMYEFRAVVENSGNFFRGTILNFKTLAGGGSGSGGDGGSGNSGGSTGVNTGGPGSGANTGGGTGGVGGGTGGGVNTGGPEGGANTGGPGGGTNTGNGGGVGTWEPGTGGGSGGWGSGIGSGTWTATKGTGGVGVANWTNVGGVCTWTSSTGSGTATGCPPGSGTWNNLVLGTQATPPVDAIVRYREGIEHVFARQIMRNAELARRYGYLPGVSSEIFAWNLADIFAINFGYINEDRREIRVSLPDIAAYQLVLIGDKLTVYEYYDGIIVDIRNTTTVFKNASTYEYYFRKR